MFKCSCLDTVGVVLDSNTLWAMWYGLCGSFPWLCIVSLIKMDLSGQGQINDELVATSK
jgi:hypothetical protein